MSASGYYSHGKRGTLDGVPIWRPTWYGELGNDKEALDAIRPRQFSPKYYEGGHRMTIDGIPIRVAAHVKKWKAANKAALCKGSETSKESACIERDMEVLFPNFIPSRKHNLACCVVCRSEYHAGHDCDGTCWTCRQAQWDKERAAA